MQDRTPWDFGVKRGLERESDKTPGIKGILRRRAKCRQFQVGNDCIVGSGELETIGATTGFIYSCDSTK